VDFRQEDFVIGEIAHVTNARDRQILDRWKGFEVEVVSIEFGRVGEDPYIYCRPIKPRPDGNQMNPFSWRMRDMAPGRFSPDVEEVRKMYDQLQEEAR
jgi:hypothetical protein